MKNTLVSTMLLAAMAMLPGMAQADLVSLSSSGQLSGSAASSPLSCFDFHGSLKAGSKGYEVRGVQFALMREGGNIGVSEYGMFGPDTVAAINAFQQKYATDILKNGAAPTGSVGKLTRAKLNALYGCSVSTSVPAFPAKVSLAVKSVSLDANGVTGTFCNNSPTDVPEFPVRLRLNGVIRDFGVTGALKAGTCDTETLPYSTWGLTYDPNATFNLVSGLDPNGMYKKSQVSYPSIGTSTISVPAIDGAHLSVRGVAIKSNGLQATVCNLGTQDLTSYPVRVTINGTSKDLDIPAAYKRGQCPTVTWAYDQFGLSASPAPGTSINALINVDPANTYKETNEFDNSATIVGNI